MATQLKLRRGTTAQSQLFTGVVGEITIDTDKHQIRVHDNATQGGYLTAREDLVVHNSGNETINGIKTFAEVIQGTALRAEWADLAENYISDEEYPVGTLIRFGGNADITIAEINCNGVISDKPGYLLDRSLENSQPVALVGKTPIRIIGKINKFDRIVLSNIPGVGKAQTTSDEKIIGIALETSNIDEEKLILCVTKFNLD